MVRGESILTPSEIARKLVDIASDVQAEDIVLLDISKISVFADYFVILSAESDRQIRAIHEEMEMRLKKDDGVRLKHYEGTAESGWLLLDFGNVIVHIFSPEQREFYGLEQVWSKASQVLRVL
ncbi:MAG: ribosome silencing factor [SAR202 cluster bacterium]|nr:ribosome silencing factor [SAR202 cluster bacterium]